MRSAERSRSPRASRAGLAPQNGSAPEYCCWSMSPAWVMALRQRRIRRRPARRASGPRGWSTGTCRPEAAGARPDATPSSVGGSGTTLVRSGLGGRRSTASSGSPGALARTAKRTDSSARKMSSTSSDSVRRRTDGLHRAEVARLGQDAVHVSQHGVGVLQRGVARRGERGLFLALLDRRRRDARHGAVARARRRRRACAGARRGRRPGVRSDWSAARCRPPA